MNAGAMRHRFEVQVAVDTTDDNGELVRTWATSATVWGEIQPTQGSERFANRQLSAETTHQIRMRYCVFTPKNRIKWTVGNTTRYFYPMSTLNTLEKGRELLVMAKEEVE